MLKIIFIKAITGSRARAEKHRKEESLSRQIKSLRDAARAFNFSFSALPRSGPLISHYKYFMSTVCRSSSEARVRRLDRDPHPLCAPLPKLFLSIERFFGKYPFTFGGEASSSIRLEIDLAPAPTQPCPCRSIPGRSEEEKCNFLPEILIVDNLSMSERRSEKRFKFPIPPCSHFSIFSFSCLFF
jgi:hypothetical protein